MGKNLRFLSFALLLLFLGGGAFAQTRILTGTVSAEDGPIPGVSILVTGTSKGVSTDGEGKYSLELAPGENSLTFSFIGYKTVTVDVTNRSVFDMSLETDATALDEVVIVGYGEQREKDLTSAITTIKNSELIKTPQGQAMQALQGKVPGLQVINSGAPGASPTVRVRGIGSMPGQGNANPLYVVDGMFFDNIDFLNPTDIETISILKDASAASIYGVRAANGVVLITTKSGSFNQKTEITYNGYYGVQVAQNVLKMANSQQYTNYALAAGTAAEAAFVNRSFEYYGRSRVNPNVPAANTDWYDKVLQTAPIQNHSIGITGGQDKIQYSLGTSYFKQDGLLREVKNSYERLNFRGKIDFKATDHLKVGANLNVSNARQYVADAGVWGTTYYAVPIMPVYDEDNLEATPFKLASAKRLGYRDSKNPFFTLKNNNNRNNIAKLLGNFYFDYQFSDKLSFKSSYNVTNQTISSRNVWFAYNDGYVENPNSLTRTNVTTFNQIVDNILTYNNNFGKHNLQLMTGYSFRSETFEGATARGVNIPTLDRNHPETWYLTSGTSIDQNGTKDEGSIASRLFGVSYIGRAAYNYDDRYLLYATFRRDGTNKYQKKWGNFFTMGAGWVLSEEAFFQVPQIDFLKIRGSWGQLGNDSVSPSIGQPTIEAISVAVGSTNTQGIFIDTNFDFVDRWETVYETNIGVTARAFQNRLTADLDYYVRDTHDAVLQVKLPASGEVIRMNGGEIRNKGFEAALNWSGEITSGIRYSVGGNVATLKNEATDLRGQTYLDYGTAEFQQRTIVGQSLTAFFGYEVEGVFQDEDDITNSGYSAEFITQKGLVPGDFKFKDQNDDGVIDGDDRVNIGSILPKFSYGFNFSVSWKGLELGATFQGMNGHSILNRKRGEINWTEDSNIDAELATNLWTGEGSSNRYPAAAGLRGTRKSWNNSMSTYLVESGDYFRVQNVRLSYNLGKKELLGVTLPEATVTLTAERPVTVFNYNGFNPEVADGIDSQTYPIPAVYTVGLNVKF